MQDELIEPTWPNDEDWLDIFEPAFGDDPDRAEVAGLVWNRLLDFVKQGNTGSDRALEILDDALRLTYPFTASFRLAYQHWRLWLSSGEILPDDEPETLLSQSIERAKAAIAAAERAKDNQRKDAKRRRRSGRPGNITHLPERRIIRS